MLFKTYYVIFVLQVWIVGLLLSLPLILEVSVDWWLNFVCLFKSYLGLIIGPSIDDQAVSLSDDGTTIIIDFFSFLFFFSLSTAVVKIPEGVVVGFQIFAWAPKIIFFEN